MRTRATLLLAGALAALVLAAAAAPPVEEPPPFVCPICGGGFDDFRVVLDRVVDLQVRGLLWSRGT